MYQIKMIPLPKGRHLNDYVNEILLTHDEEESKDMLFRLTYPYALTELKRHSKMIAIEEGLGDMSMAFMKTFSKYDPTKEGASFMNYYKMAIRTEVINTSLRNYRRNKELSELCIRTENSFAYLDEPVKNKDDVEDGTKGDLIASPYNIDDEVIANDIKDRLIKIVKRIVNENIPYKKQLPQHEKVMLYYAKTCIEGDPANSKRIERELGVPFYTVRRIKLRYEKLILKSWREEYENR